MIAGKRQLPRWLIALAAIGSIIALIVSVLALGAGAADAACPNEQLRDESNVDTVTGQPYSVGLPDCRAYEMVSPLYKQSHGVHLVNTGPTGALPVAPEGNEIGFASEGAFAGLENYNPAAFGVTLDYLETVVPRGG